MSTYETEHPYQSYDPNFNPDEVMMRLQQLQSRIASTISDVQREDDAIKERQSTIEQEVDLIGLEVFEIDSVTGTKISRIDIQADMIMQRVSYEDYNGDTITSLIVQDATSINLLAQNLNLNGLVSFTNLNTEGETIINAGNILTGTMLADHVLGGTMTGAMWQSLDDASPFEIYIGTSTRYKTFTVFNGAIHLFNTNQSTGYATEVFTADWTGAYINGETAATQNWVTNYLSSNSYATQYWVTSLGYGTGDVNWYDTYSLRRGGAMLKFIYGSATLQARNFWDDAYGTFEGLAYSNVSRREEKKDITLFEKNATQLIEETPVYSYLYNSDLDTEPKRVGLIYDEAPMEIMQFTGGIDVYSMSSLNWKAIQELNERVKVLEAGQSVSNS